MVAIREKKTNAIEVTVGTPGWKDAWEQSRITGTNDISCDFMQAYSLILEVRINFMGCLIFRRQWIDILLGLKGYVYKSENRQVFQVFLKKFQPLKHVCIETQKCLV